MRVKGYSYRDLLYEVAARDSFACFGHRLLVDRRQAQIDSWSAGQGEHGDACKNWIPNGLLRCEPPLDAHHWLSKSWLKSHERTVQRQGLAPFDLAAVLNDPRNVSACCRRHHDMLEAHLIVVRRDDLPEAVEEFAAELGDRAVARLERDFGRVPVSPVELRTGGNDR